MKCGVPARGQIAPSPFNGRRLKSRSSPGSLSFAPTSLRLLPSQKSSLLNPTELLRFNLSPTNKQRVIIIRNTYYTLNHRVFFPPAPVWAFSPRPARWAHGCAGRSDQLLS